MDEKYTYFYNFASYIIRTCVDKEEDYNKNQLSLLYSIPS